MSTFAKMHNDYLDHDRYMQPQYDEEHAMFVHEAEMGKRKVEFDRLMDEFNAIELQTHVSTIDEWFEHAPDGDFEWEADFTCADSRPINCGCCDPGWSTISYGYTLGRKDGKRWIERVDCTGMGGSYDHDTGWAYDERYGDKPEDYDGDDTHGDGYFAAWFEYWVWVFENGNDPLDEYQVPWSPTRGHEKKSIYDIAIDAMKDNLRYLKMNKDKHVDAMNAEVE